MNQRKISFFARKADGSLKPGIIKAFLMVRNVSPKAIAESSTPIWAASGGLYQPYFDFPLSSLPPVDYESKQKLILSCQTYDDGFAIAVIRKFKEKKQIDPIELIEATIQNLNKQKAL